MKRSFPRAVRRFQKGAVAVEAAVCMALILTPLLLFVLLFGRFFWHYTVVQKAIHDATLYMASAPLPELKSNAAITLAYNIIAKETADLDKTTKLEPWSGCGYKISPSSSYLAFSSCERSAPVAAVQTSIVMTLPDPFRFVKTGTGKVQFVFVTTMRYAGN